MDFFIKHLKQAVKFTGSSAIIAIEYCLLGYWIAGNGYGYIPITVAKYGMPCMLVGYGIICGYIIWWGYENLERFGFRKHKPGRLVKEIWISLAFMVLLVAIHNASADHISYTGTVIDDTAKAITITMFLTALYGCYDIWLTAKACWGISRKKKQ